jgi:hypothetical protein
MVAATAVRLSRKERSQVEQHGHRRFDSAERFGHRLAAVADRLQITH